MRKKGWKDAVADTLGSDEKGRFKLARLCFLIAAADAAGGVVMALSKGDFPAWLRLVLVFALVGSIGLLADQSLKYVNKKEKAKTGRE